LATFYIVSINRFQRLPTLKPASNNPEQRGLHHVMAQIWHSLAWASLYLRFAQERRFCASLGVSVTAEIVPIKPAKRKTAKGNAEQVVIPAKAGRWIHI
jgi:hypothetical protein